LREDLVIMSVEVVPDTVLLTETGDWRFSAIGISETGDRVPVAADWNTDGGTIDDDGYFRPNDITGAVQVTATEPHSGLQASAVVVIEPAATTQSEPLAGYGDLEIGKIHPNPFLNSTTIPFRVGSSGVIRLVVYDLLGRRVALPLEQELHPGTYEVVWDGRSFDGTTLAAGVYLVSLETDHLRRTAKVIRTSSGGARRE
jgi:hypothetical protein